jgi:hypothetical protein
MTDVVVVENAVGIKHPDFEPLVDRSFASMRLAIELFNRPDDQGRCEGVLILLHHAFELLLKAIIVDRSGTAHDEERGYSFGFDKCLSLTTDDYGVLSKDDRCFLSMLDNLRDSAVHYYQMVSEDILYIFAQGAVTLYDRLLCQNTSQSLKARLPARILPLSSRPPKDLHLLIDDEFQRLREALRGNELTRAKAVAALRPLIAFSVGAEDNHRRMTTCDLQSALDQLEVSDDWKVVFPSIAQLRISTEGDGILVGVKIVKEKLGAMPVVVVKPGDGIEPEGTIIVKEVNLLDKFTLGMKQMADQCGLTINKARGLIIEFKIQEDPESFRTFRIGSQLHKRYSKKALDILRAHRDEADAIWHKLKHQLSTRPRKPR